MPNGIWALALSAAMQVGAPGPSETPNFPALQNAYNQYGFEGQYEQRFPFDTQQNWVHGYFQEIPAYGGHVFFRPYNYKDLLSQSQVSAGWGQSPGLPYSQQFWHKYHDQATMLKLSQGEGFVPPAPAMPANQVMFLPAASSFVRQPAAIPQQIAPQYAYPPGFAPAPQYAPVQQFAPSQPYAVEQEYPPNSVNGPTLPSPSSLDPAVYVPR